jgi:hypothetical protein
MIRDSLAFQMLTDDTEIFEAMQAVAERHDLKEIEVRQLMYVRFSRPSPIGEVPAPAPAERIWKHAPYCLALSRPTRIKFVGDVPCWTAPDPTARKLIFTDEREVDVELERGTEKYGIWWRVYHTTLQSGAPFELWIPAAEMVFIAPE